MLAKKLIIKLTLCVSLLFCSGHIYSIESSEIDEQLKKAESIRTSDNQTFLKILSVIESELPQLSISQKYYFTYLKGFKSFKKGLIDEAISRFRNVEEYSDDIELRFKASILLANLYSLKQDWSKGFNYLEKLSSEYNNIQDPEVRLKALTVSASFYNELEQYELSKTFITRILRDVSDKRTRCVAYGLKIKADLSTEDIDELEDEILKSIKLCTEANELMIVNILRSYQATYHLERNEPQKSIDLLEKHITQIKNTNYQLLITETHRILAEAYFKTDNSVKAKDYALMIVLNNNSSAYLKAMLSAYKVLSIIAKQNGEYNAAFEYQEKYIEFKESLFEQTKAKQQAVESAKHQALEKDNQIALLSKQNKIGELELETQKQMQIVWAVVFISITILVFFWFYRKTSQKELARQKQVNWELQELDKLKDRILTNTSHELRTPLNGIIGLSELIVMEYEHHVEDDLIKSIRLIGESGGRLALIVNDILDLAQLKSHQIALVYKPFDLSILISEVITLCLPLVTNNDIEVEFKEENQEIIINQDKHRIRQILFNLIGNAVKFTDNGKITISCERQDDFIGIYVEDTGIGIPADKIERVFKGFEQVDNDNTRKRQGSGIGLAICHEISNAIGGEVTLTSELGKGTVATFRFPIHDIVTTP